MTRLTVLILIVLITYHECTFALCHSRPLDMAPLPQIEVTDDIKSSNFDALIVVAPNVDSIPFDEVKQPLQAYIDVDKSGESGIFVVPSNLPSKKIVFSGVALKSDYDDVTRFDTLILSFLILDFL